MSFLKKSNINKRLYLQLKGFTENTYLDVVGDLLGFDNFKLPVLDFLETDMQQISMPNNLRLGNRLERFFSFVIKKSTRYDIVAENIQIFEDKQTIGELDFILFDKKEETYIHVELGGKIYLYDPDKEGELARWIGPNKRDSLLKKTKKLDQKQFPLLYHQATASMLKILQIDLDNMTQQVCLKARLFPPKNLLLNGFTQINNEAIKGSYLSIEDFKETYKLGFYFFLPQKQDWIVAPKYGEVWFSFSEILNSIKDALTREMSPLVWVKKPNAQFETLFIVWWKD